MCTCGLGLGWETDIVIVKKIYSNLNLSSLWLTKKLYRFFVWRFYSRADCVIAPSEFAANLLREAGLKMPVKVVSNGVTENFFLPRKSKPESSLFHIVSVGRLAKEKQQPQLLRAVAASRYRDKIQLTLAGTGPQQQSLFELAKSLGLRARIGRVSDEALKELYQTANVFVQTSIVELEGMSVLEAMAAGCPVLINNASSSAVPEFVVASQARYAMNDVADLTRKLDAMLDSQALRDRASDENREIARTRHHNRSVAVLADIYWQVLGSNPSVKQ